MDEQQLNSKAKLIIKPLELNKRFVSSKNYYPIVLYPKNLELLEETVINSICSLNQIDRRYLVKPEKPEKKSLISFSMIFFYLLLVLWLLNFLKEGAFFIAISILIYHIYKRNETNKELPLKLALYHREYEWYLSKKKDIDKKEESNKIKLIEEPKRLDDINYVNNKILSCICDNLRYKLKLIEFKNQNRGIAELYFLKYLKKYFGSKIHSDKIIEHFDNDIEEYFKDDSEIENINSLYDFKLFKGV